MAAPLVIGVVPGVTPDKWVRTWRERVPDAPLTVVPVQEGDVAAALADGADMVFARLPVADPAAVHVIPLWEETPVVVAAKDHPVKLFDAVTEADLADEQVHAGWDEGVLDIVAAGHGVARMPQSVFRATGRRDLVARPVHDAEPSRIALVWSRTREGDEIQEFIGIVRGRTANSSRGAERAPEPAPAKAEPRQRGAAPATDRAARRPRRPSGRRRG